MCSCPLVPPVTPGRPHQTYFRTENLAPDEAARLVVDAVDPSVPPVPPGRPRHTQPLVSLSDRESRLFGWFFRATCYSRAAKLNCVTKSLCLMAIAAAEGAELQCCDQTTYIQNLDKRKRPLLRPLLQESLSGYRNVPVIDGSRGQQRHTDGK